MIQCTSKSVSRDLNTLTQLGHPILKGHYKFLIVHFLLEELIQELVSKTAEAREMVLELLRTLCVGSLKLDRYDATNGLYTREMGIPILFPSTGGYMTYNPLSLQEKLIGYGPCYMRELGILSARFCVISELVNSVKTII